MSCVSRVICPECIYGLPNFRLSSPMGQAQGTQAAKSFTLDCYIKVLCKQTTIELHHAGPIESTASTSYETSYEKLRHASKTCKRRPRITLPPSNLATKSCRLFSPGSAAVHSKHRLAAAAATLTQQSLGDKVSKQADTCGCVQRVHTVLTRTTHRLTKDCCCAWAPQPHPSGCTVRWRRGCTTCEQKGVSEEEKEEVNKGFLLANMHRAPFDNP